MVGTASLYEELSGQVFAGGPEGVRTEGTAQVETIDRDRSVDLYRALGGEPSSSADPGRTEGSKAIETIDRDRAGRDLYGVLGSPAVAGLDRGRTQLTESTETIDWDRPADR